MKSPGKMHGWKLECSAGKLDNYANEFPSDHRHFLQQFIYILSVCPFIHKEFLPGEDERPQTTRRVDSKKEMFL